MLACLCYCYSSNHDLQLWCEPLLDINILGCYVVLVDCCACLTRLCAVCSVLCVHNCHSGCADGDGDSVSILACIASALGGIPEQVLPWRWLQICTVQLYNH